MKFSLESLTRGIKEKDKEPEVGQQLAPFSGVPGPGVNNVATVNLQEQGVIQEYQLAFDDGVAVSPNPITAGDDVTVEYKGLLSQHGAEQVFLHCGFGFPEWERIQDIPMRKREDGTWVASVSSVDGGRFNFCFHDNAGNWDNNNGQDWSFIVHAG